MDNQAFAPGNPGFRIPTNASKDWFSYPIRFTAVAEGTPQTQNTTIDAGSDFYMTALTYFATVNGATTIITSESMVVPVATVLITDTGSNRQLMNTAAPLALIAGDGNHPHRLIHPRLFLRNSTIQVVLTTIDNSQDLTYDNIWLNLEGFRIYQ